MIHFSSILMIALTLLSSTPKTPSAEQQEVQNHLHSYFESIGKKDVTKLKFHLSETLQKAWGEESIKALANGPALKPEEIKVEIGDWVSSEGRIFVQLKSKIKADTAHQWYILSKDPKSQTWKILDITDEVDPRSKSR